MFFFLAKVSKSDSFMIKIAKIKSWAILAIPYHKGIWLAHLRWLIIIQESKIEQVNEIFFAWSSPVVNLKYTCSAFIAELLGFVTNKY